MSVCVSDVYVYFFLKTHTCTCIHMYMYTHDLRVPKTFLVCSQTTEHITLGAYKDTHKHMYMYMYICIHIYVCVYVYIYIYMCVCVCAYVCVYVCMCVCVYIYIYIYTYIHVTFPSALPFLLPAKCLACFWLRTTRCCCRVIHAQKYIRARIYTCIHVC